MPHLDSLHESFAVTTLFGLQDSFLERKLTQQQCADELTAFLKKQYPDFNIVITKSIIGRIWSPTSKTMKRPPWNKGLGSIKKARETRQDADVLVLALLNIAEQLNAQFPEQLQIQLDEMGIAATAREVARAARVAKAETTEVTEVVGEPLQVLAPTMADLDRAFPPPARR